LFGLALLFRCVGHVHYPQMSNKKGALAGCPSRRLLCAHPTRTFWSI